MRWRRHLPSRWRPWSDPNPPALRGVGGALLGGVPGRSRQLRSQLGRKLRRSARSTICSSAARGAQRRSTADLGILFRLHDARWADRPDSLVLRSRDSRISPEFARAALEARMAAPLCDGGRWSADRSPIRVADRRTVVLLPGGIRSGLVTPQPWLPPARGDDQEAIEDGASEYDMLLGDEPFKRRFATSSRRVHTVLLAPRGHPAHLSAAAGVRLRRAWRRLPLTPQAQARQLVRPWGTPRTP